MGRKKELVFNTLIIGLGKFSTQIVNLLLLPLYTSLLSTKEYGLFDLFYTIGAFAIPFITLLFEESMFRFLIDCKNEDEKNNVLSQTFIFIIRSTLIITLILTIISVVTKSLYVFVFLVYLISNIILCLKNAALRGLGKIKEFSISNFLGSAVVILLNIFFIAVIKCGFIGLILSNVIANITISIMYFIKADIFKNIQLKNKDPKLIKNMLNYSIPLIPNSLSWNIINLSDRFIISTTLGTGSNGIYSIANKFPNFLDSLYGFFYTAWKESSAKAIKDNDHEEFYNSIKKYLHNILYSMIIIIICILPFVFDLLIKKDFSKSYIYIPVLLIAMYFNNMAGFIGGIFTAYKDTKVMGLTTSISAVLNILINILLIKHIGLWAASISTLISTLFVYIYRTIKVKKHINIDDKISFIQFALLFLALCSYYKQNFLLNIFVLLICGIYSLYLNREMIQEVFYNISMKFKRTNIK